MGIIANVITETVEGDRLWDYGPIAIIVVAGAALLMLWLAQGGPHTLTAAPVRRNAVSVWLPFMFFFVWLTALMLSVEIIERYYAPDDPTRAMIARNAAMLVMNLLLTAAMLAACRRLFARRLKGLGINFRTLGGDTFWAAVNLLATYPLIIGGIGLIIIIGRLFAGPDFAIQTHQSLEELAAFDIFWVRILVIVLVTLAAPVFEEVLFRGLMQSALRSVLPGAWPAIFVSSALFALVHYSTHALSIFALSCCMGYAYERSGSLLRPILIHIFFNTVSVSALLLSA